MVSPTRTTERVAVLLGAALVATFLIGRAAAHEIPRTAVRELVRLQGYVLEPSSDAGGETVELEVLGRLRPLRLVDRQVFVAVGAAGRPTTSEPPRITLRGTRELLARVAEAGPATRITLLGERRPGAAEIFLAAVDLCPEPARD